MEKQLDIKEIARRAYSPLRNDGIEDMIAGILFFNFGAILNGQQPFAPFVVAFLPLIGWFARKVVTYPRVGYLMPAKGTPSERAGLAIALISGLGAVVLAALLLIMKHYPASPAIQTWPKEQMHVALAALLVALLVGMGVYSCMLRWYVYAALTAAFAVLGGFMRGWHPVDGVAAFSVFMTVWGLVIMTNFVRKNPVREKEAAEGPAEGAAK